MWTAVRSRLPVRVLVAAIALVSVMTAQPAVAAPADTASPEAYLAAHPGGTVINRNEVSYDGGTFIVTLTRTSLTRAVADCPSGWFCFYDSVNFGYPRGRLSDCGFQDLGTWGWRNRVESVHFATSGSVSFINETGTTDTTLFSASTTRRQLATVTPNGNKADYVYRYC